MGEDDVGGLEAWGVVWVGFDQRVVSGEGCKFLYDVIPAAWSLFLG